ncbi:uncharacterized protein LOC144166412 isoform X2 [Haemaphysalis longicornis]
MSAPRGRGSNAFAFELLHWDPAYSLAFLHPLYSGSTEPAPSKTITTDPVQVHPPESFPLPQMNMSEGRLVASPGGEKSVLSLGAEKGLAKSGLVHTVSIVVEPVEPSTEACIDDPYTCKTPTPAEEDMVRSLIMNAELRKEEFAKLLEEHAQIVMEINKAENSLA